MAHALLKILLVFFVLLSLTRGQDMNATTTTIATPTVTTVPVITTTQSSYKKNVLTMIAAIPLGFTQAIQSASLAAQDIINFFTRP